MAQVHIVGAGPGDPELITRKGYRLVQEADVVIYAGSLVNPAILEACKEGCEIHNSASMSLDDVLAVTKARVAEGKTVVRLHTGDPAIYGAIQEQMDALKEMGITYDVTPGVSSFLATAAALQQEYTLPNVTQTVIITRMEGRTPMPEKEKLSMLASHGATMCIFLSVQMIDKVAAELIEGGYDKTTPVAIVVKASWPDQRIIRGTLETIADVVAEEGVIRQAMIVVSRVLDTDYELSKLYDKGFAHMYRDAK
ncbi:MULTISPECIES: precorrin-4 C(11)-methyltransferase [unclassified Veillonella]|uniref:precorrin-4 C(11)-methyltransferase n=1 Tax=unclassified Veillonella TaxID=2630086 RepID=UPI000780F17A|nr:MULTISPECIES: precorrin-4 C(11)-methyltransferase [unclassified Veillonella]KXB87209.1 precorrin-4 C(11)-methyltransferase [Veillonella sp. DNF00869]RKW69265.1 MAG: precorrin-4 C(11)-methyltransferase [Veillonella sp.]